MIVPPARAWVCGVGPICLENSFVAEFKNFAQNPVNPVKVSNHEAWPLANG
jgi:hypothetical protein